MPPKLRLLPSIAYTCNIVRDHVRAKRLKIKLTVSQRGVIVVPVLTSDNIRMSSFANSDNTSVDQSDIIGYSLAGYQSMNGFNDSNLNFVNSESNVVRLGDESLTTQFWLNSPARSIDDQQHGEGDRDDVSLHVCTPLVSYISENRDRLHSSYECPLNSSVYDCQSTRSRDLSTNEQILADHLQVLHHNHNQPFVRVVKRRTTANKKERRRTQSINNAYADLRDCINVPADTKLSKIKTLRLALSYISYLTGILGANDDSIPSSQIGSGQCSRHSTADNKCHLASSDGRLLSPTTKKRVVRDELEQEQEQNTAIMYQSRQQQQQQRPNSKGGSKGRTGWPQHLWAMELKQQQSY